MQKDNTTATSEPAGKIRPGAPAGAEAPSLEKYIARLRRALAQEDIDEACSTYQLIRATANGMGLPKLMQLLDEALNHRAMKLLAKAHSHLHCFMCEHGRMECKDCGGEDIACSSCSGTGWVDCTFCHGTGWSDEEVIPAELRQAVLARRSKDLLRSIESYRTIVCRLTGPNGDIQANKRADLVRLGRQLSARALKLEADSRINLDQQEHIRQAGQSVRELIQPMSVA